MLVHVKHVHEGIRIPCDQCDKKYSTNQSLKLHIRTVHEGRRDWKCVSCEKEFAHSKDLKSHIKKVHESEPRKSPKIAKKSKSSKIANRNIKEEIKTKIKVEGNDVYIRS